MSAYTEFLAAKRAVVPAVGTRIDPGELHPFLRDFQRDIVTWAVGKGRAALWTTTGTGKTAMQLEWARRSSERRALILAPLAVCEQTIREAAEKLDLRVDYAGDGDALGRRTRGIWITNYERAERFDPAALDLDAVVLDEGSILRDAAGKTRNLLIERFGGVPKRLTCTATPAPNQHEELTNQAEWVGAMSRIDMLASFFIHDETGWRPKGHAYGALYRWMAQWAVALRTPSDLGYPDDDWALPGLRIVPEIVETEIDPPDGQLFATDLGGVGGRAKVRRQTLDARVARACELVDAERDEPWVLWAGLNDEADRLARDIPDAVNVHGSMSPEEKAEKLLAFTDGEIKHLVTKPSIAGRGLNWQHSARQAFVGLGDSYEDYFQCIRRSHRFGQTRVVHAHVVLSELERQIAANVSRKERETDHMMGELVREMRRAHAQEGVAA